MRTLTLISLLILPTALAAQSKVSAPELLKVIKADKHSVRPVCTRVAPNVDRLPATYDLSAQADTFFKDFQILQKYGYVSIKKVKTTDPYGGKQVDAWAVNITPKFTKDFGGTYNGERCVGEWRVQSVKAYTPPVTDKGVTYTQVTVVGKQGYTGWAAQPDLQKAVGLLPLKTTTERQYMLVQQNGKWSVHSVSY